MFAATFLVSYLVFVRGLPIVDKPPDTPSQAVPDGPNPETLGGGFQGDMLFSSRGRGAAIYGDQYRWPHNTIPYDISAIYDSTDRQTITNAMNTLMFAVGTPISGSTTTRNACVYFRPRTASDRNVLTIQYGTGCSAYIGYIANFRMTMTLQRNGCFHSGTIQHELLHVLGFWHEQSRPDRDNYLSVHLENVERSMVHNFDKTAWGSTAYNQGYPYDYSSLMHYGTTAFSTNGRPTMVPKQNGAVIGLREKLSDQDIREVRNLYKCT